MRNYLPFPHFFSVPSTAFHPHALFCFPVGNIWVGWRVVTHGVCVCVSVMRNLRDSACKLWRTLSGERSGSSRLQGCIASLPNTSISLDIWPWHETYPLSPAYWTEKQVWFLSKGHTSYLTSYDVEDLLFCQRLTPFEAFQHLSSLMIDYWWC